MDKLNLMEKPIIDESIEAYEYHEYTPETIDYNNPVEHRFIILNQDLFLDITESYLVFEGQLVRTTDDDAEPKREYKDDDNITMVNNRLMHLYSTITYKLSGQEIETIIKPGESTTMMGLLKYSADYEHTKGLNQL